MIIRYFEDSDIVEASRLAKLTWGDFYTNESPKLQNFIYSFMVEYYDLNRKYSLSIIDKELKGFLLAYTQNDKYIAANFEDKVQLLANKNEQQTAIELFNYLETCGNSLKNIMGNNDIILGLFISIKKGCGKMLLSKFVEICKERAVKNIYLWTDTTCNYQYYKKNNFILCREIETDLNNRTIKTLIYKKEVN